MSGGPGVRLRDVIGGIVGARVAGDLDVEVTSVTSDSREVVPGTVFVAVRSRTRDGHHFVAEAVGRGAVAVVVEEPVEVDVAAVEVADSRRAHAIAAAAFFGHPSRRLRVIGVTGTDGKTTTGALLDHLLTAGGRRTGRIGSLGATAAGRPLTRASTLTTPLASEVQRLLRDMAECGIEDVVVEASSVGLAERRLDAVDFDVAVVTNVTAEHVEQHDGMDAYVAAKAELVRRVGAGGGSVVVNIDDPGARGLVPAAGRASVVTFGLDSPRPDLRAVDVALRGESSEFTLRTPAGSRRVRLPLPGRFNVANALAATGTALALGVDLDAAAGALAGAPAVPGRMVVIDEGQPFSIYVDYAHTVAAVGIVLSHLRAQHPQGRLIAVAGSGLVRDYWKRPLVGRTLVDNCDLAVITAGDDVYDEPEEVAAHFAAGAVEAGGLAGRDFVCVPDRKAAIEHAVSAAHEGDVVAVLGKGHETTIVVDGRRLPWSDEAVVRAAVRRRLGERTKA